MSDPITLAVYDAKIDDYTKLTEDDGTGAHLARFIDNLPATAHVLDLGCGPGHAAAVIQARGMSVDAIDASAEMVKHARDVLNVPARQATFDDIEAVDTYDGIWASFSLLHAPRADMPRYLSALKTALKPGGTLSLGMKLGTGEARDALGRFYTYYSQPELFGLLTVAGYTVADHRLGGGVGLDGTTSDWITITAHG